MKKVYAFDFDGTLTTKDTLLEFIRYAKGSSSFWLGFLFHIHLLILMKLGFYPNWKAKQKVFAHFFKGMTIEDFDAICQDFAASSKHLLRLKGIEAVNKAISEGSKVLIISASIDNWVQPFFPKVKVLGTKIEVENGVLTGRFLTKNCYGEEKVNRLKAIYPNRHDYHLTAFGDSRGDKELLAFADESHFKPFRKV